MKKWSLVYAMMAALIGAALVIASSAGPEVATARPPSHRLAAPTVTAAPLNAQAGNFTSAIEIGGTGTTQIGATAFDPSGNLYVTGGFTGNIVFNTSPQTSLTSTQDDDLFVAKYNSTGTCLWARVANGAMGLPAGLSLDGGLAAAVDSLGNCYVGGGFVSQLDFKDANNNTVATLTDSGSMMNFEPFVAKYNTNGTLLWAVGGMSGSPQDASDLNNGVNGISDIVVDGLGNPYVAGTVAGTNFLGMPVAVAGLSDVVVSRLNPATGAPVWVSVAGGVSDDAVMGLGIDTAANIYVMGEILGMATFPTQPAPTTLTNDPGSEDSFVAKYSPNGQCLWVKQIGGSQFIFGSHLVVNGAGQIYVTGEFDGTVTFGSTTLGESKPGSDEAGLGGFLAKLDTDGQTWLWARAFGALGERVALDGAGNPHITGAFFDQAVFGAENQPTSQTLTSMGNEDQYLAKYDAAGNFKFAKALPGSGEGSENIIDSAQVVVTVLPIRLVKNPVTGALHVSGDFSGLLMLDNIMLNSGADRHGFVATLGANTTTTVASSANPSSFGQNVTFTATVAPVTPAAITPTGNVQFVIDGGAPTTVALNGSGQATLTTNSLTVAGSPHSVVANYQGDTNFNTSSGSLAGGQTVNKANTTTAITSDNPDPSVVGQAVTVAYTVTPVAPGAGTPTGNVTVNASTGESCTATVAAGSCTITFTTAGARNLTATYAGDANFNGSASAAAAHQVDKANTTTAVTSSPNPSTFGQTVTFTATVTAAPPGSGTPTGNVNFVIDGGAPSTVALNGAGQATLTTNSLTVAGSPHSVVANYQGDGNFNTSNGSLAGGQTVNKANTTTAITSDNPDPSVVGQAVTVAYTVTPVAPGAGTPTGNVTVNASTGESCTGTVAAGSCTITFNTPGARNLTATYAGDTNFNGSASAAAAHQVDKANTTTAITSDNPDPSAVGQAVTVAYTVTATAPGAGTPTGNVTVNASTGESCTGTVAAGSCTITFNTPGARNLTATYAGDANFNGSASAAAAHQVNCQTITVTAPALTLGTVGQPFNQTFTQTGGVGATTFSTASPLPTGLTLAANGTLSGTPTQAGSFPITVKATDSNGCTGQVVYTLQITTFTGSIRDPLACTGPGSVVTGTIQLANPAAVAQAFTLTTTFTNYAGVPGSCTLTGAAAGATCTVTAGGLSASGSLPANTTLTVQYLAQVADVPSGTTLTASNVATLGGVSVAPNPLVFTAFINCPAVGPGLLFPATSEVSDQKAGSVLVYNLYASSSAAPNTNNTRISITNTHPQLRIAVHLFFVDGATCSIADSLVCLTPNQTSSFLASDIDPGTTGYIVAVASSLVTGCPVNFNYLIGDEYVKLSSNHAANLTAEGIAAIAGGLPVCNPFSVTAELNFNGISYNRVPRVLAASNIPARADGNDTLIVLNRFGGNLAIGAATLTGVFGILYDDAENPISFTFNPGTCQFRSSLSNNFPRTAPRFEQFIPAGRSGWAKLYSLNDQGLFGAQLNFNANAGTSAGAFNQGHNLHKLTLTQSVVLTIPIFPPNC